MTLLQGLAVSSAVCAGTIGGVFFAFSAFVMQALEALPAAHGMAAMQRINVTVITPLFLGVFIGTAPLLGVTAWMAHGAEPSAAFRWLVGSSLVYLVGSVGVTMVFNVPRNDRLARLDPDSPTDQDDWTVYVREWTVWNHVRCVASLLAAAGAAVAIGV